MKNECRVNGTAYTIAQLDDLIKHLETELDFALPCYEDGTLSPRRSLQYIREKLLDIKRLTAPITYRMDSTVSSNTLPPPATPEALE